MDLSELGLGPHERVLLDASPLIYLVEGGAGSPRARPLACLLEAAGKGGPELIASTLLWTEVLARPEAQTRQELGLAYRSILADSRRLRLLPLDAAIADRAAVLQSRHPDLALGDSIHLATALVHGAAAVLTNDEAWVRWLGGEKKGPGTIRVLLVDELAWV